MAYELTRYGEEYFEKLPELLSSRRELLRGKGKSTADTTFYRLNKRYHILGVVRSGGSIESSFDWFPSHWMKRKTRAISALKKEAKVMLRENLIREVAPGWEQKIQVDLGSRHPGSVTVTQEEYEGLPPGRRSKGS